MQQPCIYSTVGFVSGSFLYQLQCTATSVVMVLGRFILQAAVVFVGKVVWADPMLVGNRFAISCQEQHLVVVSSQQGSLSGVQPILTVIELNDGITAVANSEVIVNFQLLTKERTTVTQTVIKTTVGRNKPTNQPLGA